MRVKSKWFKKERAKTPREIADAMAFIVWRIGLNALKNTRQADFDVAVGEQYFSFLSEFLIFLVQVADRIAYRRLDGETRAPFTTALAVRLAEILAENRSELLGGTHGEHKNHFIEQLNRRAGEYAEFEYGGSSGGFAFVRHLGYCMMDVVAEKDKSWVVDQMTTIEAPEAVATVEKAMSGLLEDAAAHHAV
ncbi:MAG: hypothetical protein FD134_2613 [Gallionellaceae bacterium]|nr:MAG: hypothetical protein FD134_2613 [Gallionellaceae bacterium]